MTHRKHPLAAAIAAAIDEAHAKRLAYISAKARGLIDITGALPYNLPTTATKKETNQ